MAKAPIAKAPMSGALMSKPLMSRPLALTSGEPAGIGPDIAIAAWLRRMELNLPPFYLLGDRAFFAERAKILGLKVELADAGPEDASSAFAKALPVVATGEIATARPGQPDETSANAALASIRHAVDHVSLVPEREISCEVGERTACAVAGQVPRAAHVVHRGRHRHSLRRGRRMTWALQASPLAASARVASGVPCAARSLDVPAHSPTDRAAHHP